VRLHAVRPRSRSDLEVEAFFFGLLGLAKERTVSPLLAARLGVGFQEDVDYVFEVDTGVLIVRRLGVLEHELGQVEDAVPHLEGPAQQEVDALGLFLQVALGHFTSLEGQLYLDAVHDELHRFYVLVPLLNLLHPQQVVFCGHHLQGSFVQARVLLEFGLVV